jgi:leucine dehydrogenase
MTLESLLSQWDGEEVLIRFDRPAGAWVVIAIHSTHEGVASGGTRMKPYPNLAAAVADAMRLAEAMTAKFALAEFGWGGGKAVIAVPPVGLTSSARRDLLRRYGTLVHQLDGLFRTGPDVGTSPADMDVIAETGAPYVFGRTPEAGGAGDSGPPTALGVFHSIRVVARRLFGSDLLAGKVVLVQGLGHVGRPLVGSLVDAGARVLVSDVDGAAVREVQQRFGVDTVDPDGVLDTPCDIFSPCALGGILNHVTIPRLQCGGIAGAANNQLDTADDARRLRERGILYAPDFVVNVGGTVALVGIEGRRWSIDEVERRITDTVTQSLERIFDLAAEEEITTPEAAERVVEMHRRATRCASVKATDGGVRETDPTE